MRQVAVLLQNLAEHVNEKTLSIIRKNIQVLHVLQLTMIPKLHHHHVSCKYFCNNNTFTCILVKALIEMCAGNSANQETIFKGHIVDSINLILKNLVESNALLFEV